MNKLKVVCNLISVPIVLFLTTMIYIKLVGFSASVPYPSQWNISSLHPFKYWGFLFITLLVPYLLILSSSIFLLTKFNLFYGTIVGVLGATFIFIDNLASLEGFPYVLAVYVITIIAIVPSFVSLYKKHNKAMNEAAKAADGGSLK